MPDQTRVDYESLASVAAQFEREAQRIKQTTQGLARGVEALCGQSWVGRGADVFHREMESSVLPGLNRLEQALTEGGRSLKAVSRLFQDAEAEAAGYLKISAEGGDGSDGGDGGGGDGSGTANAANALSGQGGNPEMQFAGDAYDGPEVSDDVKAKWNTLTKDQKKQALQNMADDIARQNGMKSIPVSVENMPDGPEGQHQFGGWNGQKVRINEADLDNPAMVMNAVAHESRHAVQQEMASRVSAEAPSTWTSVGRFFGWEKGPDLPAGISEDEARAWKNNQANYNPAPTYKPNPNSPLWKDFSQKWSKYRGQPVEADAFNYGNKFAKGMTAKQLDGYVSPPASGSAPKSTP